MQRFLFERHWAAASSFSICETYMFNTGLCCSAAMVLTQGQGVHIPLWLPVIVLLCNLIWARCLPSGFEKKKLLCQTLRYKFKCATAQDVAATEQSVCFDCGQREQRGGCATSSQRTPCLFIYTQQSNGVIALLPRVIS